MAAACNLLDAGLQVTLIEKRPYLGGRAFSFPDRETGQEVDNGQHIFLGCCTYYIDFLKKLGTFRQAHLQSKMLVKVLSPGHIAGQLSTAPLPKPLHLLPSFLTYRHLGLKDKALALYALTRIALTNRSNPALSTETFGHWLKKHHQTQRSIDNFWNIIVKPCVNDDVSNVTAAMAMMVFQEGMMKTRHGSSIGYSKVGLS
ncbi:MAG: FAD-dependent oxidoreductase, partial [Dehalococcoidia bacterium]